MFVPPHFQGFASCINKIIDSFIVDLHEGDHDFIDSFIVITLLKLVKKLV